MTTAWHLFGPGPDIQPLGAKVAEVDGSTIRWLADPSDTPPTTKLIALVASGEPWDRATVPVYSNVGDLVNEYGTAPYDSEC
ncbi:MAG: hypothetical protein OXH75_07700 [Acidobacteria bacterium]|nr:hypothetical protein [Acidobacteriota bacterium]